LHLVEWPENCLQCRRAKSNIITLMILQWIHVFERSVIDGELGES